MVVGNGIISKAFASFLDDTNILIFASGVSNSKQNDLKEYNREFELIKSYSEVTLKFIYFSTININNDGIYFKHKLEVEDYIQKNFRDYIIFRLPNVIGYGGNDNNIFNFFKKSILNNSTIYVQDVYRSLVDIDDIVMICEKCFSLNLNRTIINISNIEKVKAIDIVGIISEFLEVVPNVIFIESVTKSVDLENTSIVEDLINKNIDKISYTRRTIKKYLNI
jgi:nucleoside-diphosphate-sugar epimerase